MNDETKVLCNKITGRYLHEYSCFVGVYAWLLGCGATKKPNIITVWLFYGKIRSYVKNN